MITKINFVILTTLVMLLSCSSCSKDNDPILPAPCPIEYLMLDTSSLPEGWLTGKPSRAPERWGIERLSAHSSFESEYNVLYQHVHRGENYKHTTDGYFDLMPSWFYSDEDLTEWYLPLEFPYKNTVADRYRFGCARIKHNNIEICNFVGQYGVYITELRVLMFPSVTYDDLEQILQTVDNKMLRCLGK